MDVELQACAEADEIFLTAYAMGFLRGRGLGYGTELADLLAHEPPLAARFLASPEKYMRPALLEIGTRAQAGAYG